MKFSGLINANLMPIRWDDWDYPMIINQLFLMITFWIFFFFFFLRATGLVEIIFLLVKTIWNH